MLHRRPRGGGGDGPRQGARVEHVEQLDHAGLQRDARLGDVVEVVRNPLAPPDQVEPLAEMLQHDAVADEARQADQPLEELERHLLVDAAGRGLHRLEHHLLGVDEQAVHVEHDGLDAAGKIHAGP